MQELRELLHLIGIPGIPTTPPPNTIDPLKLFELARKNKISLLLLNNIEKLSEEKKRYNQRYTQVLNMLRFLGKTFTHPLLNYVLIKTIKPYPYIPSDVDLLMKTSADLQKAVSLLRKEGFILVEKEKHEITLFSEKYSLNVDLYLELNVVDFIYLDKTQLFKHTDFKTIHDSKIRVLRPPAELVVVASHALYKEQIVTLNDFYTFLTYHEYLIEGKTIARNTKTLFAYNFMLQLMYKLLNWFSTKSQKGEADLKSGTTKGEQPDFPHKASWEILLKAFWEKLFDSYALPSLLDVTKHLLKPKFYKNLISHRLRETY